ncbi:carbon-nitrogen hydrolase family protein [Lignipirellula cremea]|uniref:N-carbamoyl-D-amino acid hydrolase n=1 Tax=Lignipirellula cremea TaxID=2528010 RepID=A0A518DLW6_9BACT|nr:carbon-nitrogen hydrolase family protein [Lignipirellula cremea]QDU92811.1 N-carbamoyl-D-amino acid hydrolase [Lignipirellula cremea]
MRIFSNFKGIACALAALVCLASGKPVGSAEPQRSPARNPLVRVATISLEGVTAEPGRARLEAAISRLDQAAAFGPDIVCLPECFTRGEPEAVPGATIQRLSVWAKKHGCYLLCPLLVRDGERTFNSAVLLDRQGEIVGRYDKIRPTEGELEKAICPGVLDPPVFPTDFGLIGVQICFDVNWHAQWRRLREKGACIIFFPSAYPAARQLRSHAWRNQCFVVSATLSRAASIYDITGETLCSTGKFQAWTGAVLPVGKTLFEIDFHISKFRQIMQKYGDRVQVEWFHDDDLATLASLDPDLTVEDLIKEFALTPHPAYIERAEETQDDLRPAKENSPQQEPKS